MRLPRKARAVYPDFSLICYSACSLGNDFCGVQDPYTSRSLIHQRHSIGSYSNWARWRSAISPGVGKPFGRVHVEERRLDDTMNPRGDHAMEPRRAFQVSYVRTAVKNTSGRLLIILSCERCRKRKVCAWHVPTGWFSITKSSTT